MNYGKFIEELNKLQEKGLVEVVAKFDILALAQELHQEAFERGLKMGRDIEKR